MDNLMISPNEEKTIYEKLQEKAKEEAAQLKIKIDAEIETERLKKQEKEKNKIPSWAKWIIALFILLIFAITTPKTLESYGHTDRNNSVYYQVKNYFLFSVCLERNHYKWETSQIGILGITFRIK